MTRLTTYILTLILCLAASYASAGGISPFAEVLAWQPSEATSTSWASVVSTSPSLQLASFAPPGVEFDWSPGMRAGFAFQADDSPWNAKLYWTYLPSTSSASVPAGLHVIAPEFFSGFLSGEIFNSASIDWNLYFNTFDFEFGYDVPLTESVTLRPWTGLKAAIIQQSIHVDYADLLVLATEDVDHDYWGIGLAFGVDGRWDLPTDHPCSLVGSFSGAFMSGEWNIRDTFESLSTTIETGVNDSSLGTLMLRYFLGIEWAHPGKTTATLRLGYEWQWWANQNRAPTFQILPLHGDLTLQGGSCVISFLF
jgi:hypothetical protein